MNRPLCPGFGVFFMAKSRCGTLHVGSCWQGSNFPFPCHQPSTGPHGAGSLEAGTAPGHHPLDAAVGLVDAAFLNQCSNLGLCLRHTSTALGGCPLVEVVTHQWFPVVGWVSLNRILVGFQCVFQTCLLSRLDLIRIYPHHQTPNQNPHDRRGVETTNQIKIQDTFWRFRCCPMIDSMGSQCVLFQDPSNHPRVLDRGDGANCVRRCAKFSRGVVH